MAELVVVLGTLVVLAVSIAAMDIYGRRNDVLTGPYISNRGRRPTILNKRANRIRRTGRKRRKVRSFGQGRKSDLIASLKRRAIGYYLACATARNRLRNAFQSAQHLTRETGLRKIAEVLTQNPGRPRI